MNKYTIVKVIYSKSEKIFAAVKYIEGGGYEVAKFKWARNLFDHLLPMTESPSNKIIFEIRGMSPDFKWYQRLMKKKIHYEKLFNEFNQKLGGHSNLIDTKWDASREPSNLYRINRGNRGSQQRISSDNIHVSG
jgi:hypothetical protein